MALLECGNFRRDRLGEAEVAVVFFRPREAAVTERDIQRFR